MPTQTLMSHCSERRFSVCEIIKESGGQPQREGGYVRGRGQERLLGRTVDHLTLAPNYSMEVLHLCV